MLVVWSRYARGTVEVRSWYGRDMLLVWLRYDQGTLLVRSRYAPGTVEVCSWCASGTLTGAVPVLYGTLNFYRVVLYIQESVIPLAAGSLVGVSALEGSCLHVWYGFSHTECATFLRTCER